MKLKDMGYKTGLVPSKSGVYVKMPVFSFSKLKKVDTVLGPEMKSTGEIIGKDVNLPKALYKAFRAANIELPEYGTALLTIADKDKQEMLPLAKRLVAVGYRLLATKGTGQALLDAQVPVTILQNGEAKRENILKCMHDGEIQFIINTMTEGKTEETDGYFIRREAADNNLPCLTSLDTAEALLQAMEMMHFQLQAVGTEPAF